MLVQDERVGKGGDNAACHRLCVFAVHDVHDDLVTAETCREVAGSDDRAKPVGQLSKNEVSGMVAPRFGERPLAVEVEEQRCRPVEAGLDHAIVAVTRFPFGRCLVSTPVEQDGGRCGLLGFPPTSRRDRSHRTHDSPRAEAAVDRVSGKC